MIFWAANDLFFCFQVRSGLCVSVVSITMVAQRGAVQWSAHYSGMHEVRHQVLRHVPRRGIGSYMSKAQVPT